MYQHSIQINVVYKTYSTQPSSYATEHVLIAEAGQHNKEWQTDRQKGQADDRSDPCVACLCRWRKNYIGSNETKTEGHTSKNCFSDKILQKIMWLFIMTVPYKLGQSDTQYSFSIIYSYVIQKRK